MKEEERIAKYLANRNPFRWWDTNNGIKFVHKIKLKNVEFRLDLVKLVKLKCYLYKLHDLGITATNLAEEFEGKSLLFYKNTKTSLSSRRTKCAWCYAPVDNFEEHIKEVHNKTMTNILYMKFQQNLYKELLRVVRETRFYFATAFINVGCQLCDNPVMKGRELCCSIPTSFRDRARSLKLLGLHADGLKQEWLKDPLMGQIILAP